MTRPAGWQGEWPAGRFYRSSQTEPKRLVCPYCGDEITAELTYTARYSEHRDLTGYECDNYQCDARWTPRGDVERLSRMCHPAESAGGT